MNDPIDPGSRPDQIPPMHVFLARDGRTIEFDEDGSLRRASLSSRIMFWAIAVAVLAGAAAFALLAFWLALFLIPVAAVAALVGWGLLRFRLWQAGRGVRRPGGWA
ncbi:MAG: hypothetical protein KGK10_11810 [Rhodospirillales bacterium]|nr:hypothetical protein [Rhodospirillales bacterium]